MFRRTVLLSTLTLGLGVSPLLYLVAQGNDPLVDIDGAGSDGEFAPTTDTVVDLARARAGAWDTDVLAEFGAGAVGDGVYDGEKWAVVYKYSSVVIPEDVTVTFANHPSRAPVVWLVAGDVSIDGTVNLSGEGHRSQRLFPEPGPGGFRGGAKGLDGSSGFGPGGTFSTSATQSAKSGASHGTPGGGNATGPTYGNEEIVPLIGGSGGAGLTDVGAGGAGGGAILIVANSITLGGTIVADGGFTVLGSSAGSGGAIRLVARSIDGVGRLQARSPESTPLAQAGGDGRIRLESIEAIGPNLETDPAASVGAPGDPVVIWPAATDPSVRIVSIGGIDVPADPLSNLSQGADVELLGSDPVDIVVETVNVPVAGALVEVRVTPREGAAFLVPCVRSSGGTALARWTASDVELPQTIAALQVLVGRP